MFACANRFIVAYGLGQGDLLVGDLKRYYWTLIWSVHCRWKHAAKCHQGSNDSGEGDFLLVSEDA
jgi:hypothetical protein